MSELKRCQEKNGNGWAGSSPEKYLHWLAQGKPTWAPQYVHHKTLMGLVDMYTLAGNTEALEIADQFADWFYRWTLAFSREKMDDILDVETGGMLEVWANLYDATGDPKYLALIEKYTRARLFDPLMDGCDMLTNRHANTTIPEVQGAARAYEVTGDERWRQIVEAYWRSAVTDRGMYCTGGQTCGEVWTPPFKLSARLGDKNQEHCTVYNMIRLADYLFRWTGEPVYADYIERNLYNGILAQQNPRTGMVAYFLPLEAGARKVRGSRTYDFWCCHGSLVQAHAMHNALVYYEDEAGIVVCQYIPAVLQTHRDGVAVSIRQSRADSAEDHHCPAVWRLAFQVTCEKPVEFTLKLRSPWWLSGEPSVVVNGENLPAHQGASEWLSIRRAWTHDTLTLELPKGLYVSPLPDAPDVCAFTDGPMVLGGLCSDERTLVGNKDNVSSMLVPDNEREWGNWLPGYRARHQAQGLRFKPLYEITGKAYTVYFPIVASH